MIKDLTAVRYDYQQGSLNEDQAALDPFTQFNDWLHTALHSALREPYAMTLATSTPDGYPTARVVLLRQFDSTGLVFYTNYTSAKGLALQANPRAAVVFYWDLLERQVRVTGDVTRLSAAENQVYFSKRPHASQLAAMASPQSQAIPNSAFLKERIADLEAQYPLGSPPPCPPNWGGLRLAPHYFEFWQGRPSRLHDRLAYTRQPDNTWLRERLAP